MISAKQFIRETGFKPKKIFGQNFLIHPESAEKIVRFAGVGKDDSVLEIGPGLGALTEALLASASHVTAVEKDRDLVEILGKQEWPKERFQLIHGDALVFDVGSLKTKTKLKVISNLPYSVSTPILETLLKQLPKIQEMVLLLQEEVVDRICAQPGNANFGRLSVWIQTVCATERGPRIPAGSFYPEPDVESRLVRLTPRLTPLVPAEKMESFLKLVALLFQHRRKTVRNALKDSLGKDAPIDEALKAAKIDPKLRPEAISITTLFRLSEALRS